MFKCFCKVKREGGGEMENNIYFSFLELFISSFVTVYRNP